MEFKNDLDFLSNYYHTPIVYKEKEYSTVEHFFQSYKTLEKPLQEVIRNANTPGKAKRLGRNVALREDWERDKHLVMTTGVHLKFSSSTELKAKLLATGDLELVEGNTWHDNHWGDCSCTKCKDIVGENRLGIMLMEVRDILKEED